MFFFGQTVMEYLGPWVKCDGVKPINKNRSNKNMIPPNSRNGGTSACGFSKPLSQHVFKTLTYIRTFNKINVQ